MSCCSGCESGMGCSGHSLMGALLVAGSRVRAGFEYQSIASSADSMAGYDSPSNIQDVLQGAMLGSGVFAQAFIEVKPPAFAGFTHGYITASGTTYTDVGDPIQISDLIYSLIQQYLPQIQVTRRDPVAVDAIPQSAVGKSGVQQVYDPSQQATQNQSGQPSKCNWSQQSVGDYLACQIGLDTKTSVGIGAVGALAAVVLLLVVLKK